MIEYIVTWTVVNMIVISCPQVNQPENEYGFSSPYYTSTLRLCYEKSSKKMEKIFNTLDDAKKFIEEGKKISTFTNYLEDFEIKEILKAKQ